MENKKTLEEIRKIFENDRFATENGATIDEVSEKIIEKLVDLVDNIEYRKELTNNTRGIINKKGAEKIAVYNSKGKRVGNIELGNLAIPSLGEKLYSFGALSDIHLQYDTAMPDFQKALQYLNNTEDVDFTCICGDLTVNGTSEELTTYKEYVSMYSPDTPVYAVAGNHDTYGGIVDNIQTYTGYPLRYTFERGDDVFIMMGIRGDSEGNFCNNGDLQWLYNTLEANRNKRCFLFEHIPPIEGCGDALGVYSFTKLESFSKSVAFKSLLSHYSNVIFFHGHTHMKFYLQKYNDIANYDKVFGSHGVHIPSLAVPRDTSGSGYTTVYADSEGYVVDVYENGIHLRGRDFVKEEFIPIASYWLDTTLQTIPEKTYTDSTGIITTK